MEYYGETNKLKTLTMKKLKIYLSAHCLSVSGNKTELIQRISEHICLQKENSENKTKRRKSKRKQR